MANAILAAPGEQHIESPTTVADPLVGRMVDQCKSFIGGLFDAATSVQVIIDGEWYSVREQALSAIESCRDLDQDAARLALHAMLRHIDM